MLNLLLALLVFVASPSYADLYRCSSATQTRYQDTPCRIGQSQLRIAQQPEKAVVNPTPILPNASVYSSGNITVERDAHGKIKRSEKTKNDFKAISPCPANGKRSGSCPGYVIDHIKPLACGGADSPENMQWQTIVAGKAKDAWERDDCQAAKISTQFSRRTLSTYQKPNSSGQQQTQTVYIGKRGGRYVMTATGKKHYLKRR